MIHASTYASWFGAYSSTVTGPRVTLSTNAVGNQETYALEAVLHESVHAGRLLETVDSALAATGTRRGAALEPELSHAILFYTTGELLAGLIPTHVPYAERFGFWTRNRETTRLKEMVADAWRPYVAGSARLADAVDAMVRRASSR
ncbi:MAG TPA: hypothetical protein VD793_12010 [Gemmatimonadales bacterium]|nr:hypothetical protein [Gemmatimonadales bacterium]